MDINTLKAVFEIQISKLNAAARAFPWHDKMAYAGFMKQTYSFCRHTPTLLTLCAGHLMDDPKLQKRFAGHAQEEFAHDILAVSDINALGLSLDEVPTLPIIRAFVQSQYYWIERVSAQSFFGYILFLETLPETVGSDVYEAVVNAHGVEAGSFLRVHQLDDPGHISQAWSFVDGFSEEQLQQVHDNLIESSENYKVMLESFTIS